VKRAVLAISLIGLQLHAAESVVPKVMAPRPELPRAREIAPPEGFVPPRGIPVVDFADGGVITKWHYAKSKRAGALAAALAEGADDKAGEFLAQLVPLPADAVPAESYPDFEPAVDLRKLAGGKDNVTFSMLCVLKVGKPRTVRVCLGTSGENVKGKLRIGAAAAAHDSLARLQPGLHPLVLDANSGRRRHHWQWKGRLIAPRFTEITEQEIRDVHAWKLAYWQETLDAAKADPAQLVAHVEIDPKTVRGKEGFFRVGRSVNGFWWLIDPDGKPWYHRGCCGLNSGGIGGRRRKNAKPVPDAQAEKWLKILKGYGFNALGSWTTEEFFNRGWPYADIIDAFYVPPYIDGNNEYHRALPDVFDPEWAKNLDARCRTICPISRTNRMMIGYFVDNERGFKESRRYNTRFIANSPTYVLDGVKAAQAGMVVAAEPKDDAKALGLLQYCLSFSDRKPPAYKKAREFILDRHGGTLAKVGEAWGVTLDSEDAIKELTARSERLISKAYLDDEDAFVELFVDRYYRLATETIRRHDPNHLVLGMRHGGTPGSAVLRAEARWTDVISRNSYRAELVHFMDGVYRDVGRPVLTGEFPAACDSFEGIPSALEPPGGPREWDRKNDRRQTGLNQFFKHPGGVGYTWYKWRGRGPAYGDIRWMAVCNLRALAYAARADRPRAESPPPFHGRYAICLHAGEAWTTELPAPRPGGKPSLKIRAAHLFLGFVCQEDRWGPVVYGNGIRGKVTAQNTKDGKVSLNIRIRAVPGMYTRHEGSGEYELEFVRDRDRIGGSFSGKWNGVETEGPLQGYLDRPVPTMNL